MIDEGWNGEEKFYSNYSPDIYIPLNLNSDQYRRRHKVEYKPGVSTHFSIEWRYPDENLWRETKEEFGIPEWGFSKIDLLKNQQNNLIEYRLVKISKSVYDEPNFEYEYWEVEE